MYILIMTIVISGVGVGQSNLLTGSLEECGRVGSVWQQSVSKMRYINWIPSASFICIELDK